MFVAFLKMNHMHNNTCLLLARLAKEGPPSQRFKIEPELDSWIETKASKVKEHSIPGLNISHSVLPSVLVNIPNLPPSLVPSTIFEFYDAQKSNVPEWG